MTDQEELEAKLGEAFHLMYDGLPEPVQLCHKTYRVVAVNPACAAYGLHTEKTENSPCATTFWIPVAGYPDYYVHFGIGVTIDFAARPTETA